MNTRITTIVYFLAAACCSLLFASYVSGEGTNTWTMTIATPIQSGETVDLDFSGAANSVEDSGGNDLAAIVSASVTNNSTQGGGYDTDAADFFTRAGITDTTQKDAVNQLVLDFKSASVWTKMKAIYPFVGGTSAKHSHNLKSSSYQITWSGSITHDANGITGGGGTGDTGLNINTLTTDSYSVGVNSRTNTGLGANDFLGGSGSSFLGIACMWSDNVCYFDSGDSTAEIGFSVTSGAGTFIGSRTASNAVAVYRNGTSLGTGSGTTAALPSANMVITTGSRNLAFAFVADGLNSTEVGAINTAIATFELALSR